MFVSIVAMTDDQLLQNLAIHRENAAIRMEIERRVGSSEETRQLVSEGVEKLRIIEEMDSDLIDQSGRCKRLSQEYLEIRSQLLQKMN